MAGVYFAIGAAIIFSLGHVAIRRAIGPLGVINGIAVIMNANTRLIGAARMSAIRGTSPIFIRKGLEGLPSSLWGVTVGLFSATGVYMIWLLFRWQSRRITAGVTTSESRRMLDPAMKIAIFIQALAGVAAGLGTVGRTLSIDLAPIVVAIPLAQTTSLFTLIFAPLILGTRNERVNFKLAAGVVFVLIGSALVVIGQNQ